MYYIKRRKIDVTLSFVNNPKTKKNVLQGYRKETVELIPTKIWNQFVDKNFEMTTDHKISSLLKGTMDKDTKYKNKLIFFLMIIPYKKVCAHFEKFFGDDQETPLTNYNKVDSISSLFFDKIPNFHKRELERKNISSFGNNHQLHIKMNDVIIPSQIFTRNVFLYFKYDYKFLVDIGSICQNFYMMILKTWPSVKIRIDNVYSISTLVLKNVKKIIFDEHIIKSMLWKFEDLNYLWGQLVPGTVNSIVFQCSPENFFSIIKHLSNLRKTFGDCKFYIMNGVKKVSFKPSKSGYTNSKRFYTNYLLKTMPSNIIIHDDDNTTSTNNQATDAINVYKLFARHRNNKKPPASYPQKMKLNIVFPSLEILAHYPLPSFLIDKDYMGLKTLSLTSRHSMDNYLNLVKDYAFSNINELSVYDITSTSLQSLMDHFMSIKTLNVVQDGNNICMLSIMRNHTFKTLETLSLKYKLNNIFDPIQIQWNCNVTKSNLQKMCLKRIVIKNIKINGMFQKFIKYLNYKKLESVKCDLFLNKYYTKEQAQDDVMGIIDSIPNVSKVFSVGIQNKDSKWYDLCNIIFKRRNKNNRLSFSIIDDKQRSIMWKKNSSTQAIITDEEYHINHYVMDKKLIVTFELFRDNLHLLETCVDEINYIHNNMKYIMHDEKFVLDEQRFPWVPNSFENSPVKESVKKGNKHRVPLHHFIFIKNKEI